MSSGDETLVISPVFTKTSRIDGIFLVIFAYSNPLRYLSLFDSSNDDKYESREVSKSN